MLIREFFHITQTWFFVVTYSTSIVTGTEFHRLRVDKKHKINCTLTEAERQRDSCCLLL